ncbi:hypothetical protein HCDG_02581 [Histoplasma capsulatum H143]|uniref:Uncharacterized protein n=1 Tax=Ajellomyces capsulatus (strain H143) TaxID=544712 RepID=C6H8Q0_AJECH|nr:hypothetical protein HCDG_02581 [Histoplasma capsulatum H143]
MAEHEQLSIENSQGYISFNRVNHIVRFTRSTSEKPKIEKERIGILTQNGNSCDLKSTPEHGPRRCALKKTN